MTAASLMFVHGAHVGGWIWHEHFVPHFEQRGHACTAVELRDETVAEEPGIAEYAGVLARALADAPEPPVVVAHSMGAVVALRAIAQRPAADAPRALIVFAPVPPFGLASSLPLLCATHPALWTAIGAFEWNSVEMPPAGAIEGALFASSLPREERRRLLARARPESRRALGDMLSPLVAGCPLPLAAGFGTRRPACPIHLIGGGADKLFPSSLVKLSAWWLDASSEIVPRMGHLMMLEQDWPRAAAALERALERHGSAATGSVMPQPV